VRASRITLLAAGLAVLAGGAAGVAPAAAAATPATAVPSRLPGQATVIPHTNLGAVAVLSGRPAWIVGSRDSGDDTVAPLILGWNGKAWAQVPSPVPAMGGDLLDVAATSASNAWAVGHTGGTPGIPSRPMIEHWDGTAWKQVPSPQPGGDSSLVSIAAVSARSAWAVGTAGQRSGTCPCQGLIEHWDGTAWKRAPRLHQPGIVFSAVAASSARNAWAVGDRRDKHGNVKQTVIEHWNGRAWKLVPSPDAKLISLNGVAAVSARSAWAVGLVSQQNGSDCQCRGIIEHWDGTAWKRVPSHAPAGSNLFAVSPVSGHDAWAVGYHNAKSLILHWNGTAWKQVPSVASPRSQALSDVTASSARSAWAVGGTNAGGGSGLILHWDGTAWR
jgi:hypothetical protein